MHLCIQDTQIEPKRLYQVPWWNNSSLITIPEHVAWWGKTFYKQDGSLPPNRTEGYMEHLLRGGDILGPFIAYTRAAKMKAFVSWRMADSQAFASYASRWSQKSSVRGGEPGISILKPD